MKNPIFFISLLLICMISGCSKTPYAEVPSPKDYTLLTRDMQIAFPMTQDGQMYFQNELCIFHSLEGTDNTYAKYYTKNLMDDGKPMDIGIGVKAEEYVTDYYKNNIYILCESKGDYSIKEYDIAGNLINDLEFAEQEFAFFPSFIGVYDDNSVMIGCADEIVFFDEKGVFVSSLKNKEYLFRSVINCQDDNVSYVLASKKNGNKSVILEINKASGETKEIGLPDTAEAVTVYGEEIYFVSEKAIYRIDLKNLKYEEIFVFTDERNIFKDLCNVIKRGDDYIIVKRRFSGISEIFKAFIFKPCIEAKPTECENISLYDPNGLLEIYNLNDIIASFNEDNPNICIDIQEYDKDINYVMSSDNKPDIILGHGYKINELGKSGYMYDISELFSQSETLKEEDFIDGLLEKTRYNGKLYSLPRFIGITTMGGPESKVGSKVGWTVDEFLDWLIAEPEALSESWLQKEDILKICLEGSLKEYEDADFKPLLKKVNEVTTYPNNGVWVDFYADVISISCESFLSASAYDDNYGERFVFKGFPTSDGTPRYDFDCVALGILEDGKNKEAAYKFVEYFVKYRYGDPCLLYSTKDMFERAKEASSLIPVDGDGVTRKYVYLSEEQINRPINALPYLEAESEYDKELIEIIVEDASLYFNGSKTLEETSEIIKQRVKLYIDEKKP